MQLHETMNQQSGNISNRAAQLLSLDGKVAVIPGAASGIGSGIARRLAEMGACIVILDIDEETGTRTAAQLEAQTGYAIFTKCDVRNAADCRQAVERTLTK